MRFPFAIGRSWSGATVVCCLGFVIGSVALAGRPGDTTELTPNTRPEDPPFNDVRRFGAVGDGKADDTEAINAALRKRGEVYFPPGAYRITSSLTVRTNTHLRGAGPGLSILRMMTKGEGNTIEVVGSNTTIRDLSIQGPRPADEYAVNEIGVLVSGESAAARLANVRIVNCEVYNYGGYGVLMKFVGKARVLQNEIRRIGYAAVMCVSCDDVHVSDNLIASVRPGEPGHKNAYGISFTSSNGSSGIHPVSKRCMASGNVIENIPSWSGLDTHRGQSITFANNIVKGCRIGIHAGAADGGDGTMRDISITGNNILGGKASHRHYGIVVSGHENQLAFNIVVANNIVDGYGQIGNDQSGAVQIVYTDGVAVTGNLVRNFAESGILFWHDNTNFICSGNLTSDGRSIRRAYGIRVRAQRNQGFIFGNRLGPSTVMIKNDRSNAVMVRDNDGGRISTFSPARVFPDGPKDAQLKNQ